MQKFCSSCGILIRARGLWRNACAVLWHRSCVSEKRRACLIIDRGEKLPVHHQARILSDDIASPVAGHMTDSVMSADPGDIQTIGAFRLDYCYLETSHSQTSVHPSAKSAFD